MLISKDILVHEMYNAHTYDTEEKLPLTKIAQILEGAHSTCFTVGFNAKVDEAAVRERLSAATAAELKDGKALTKEILLGREI